MNSRKRRIFLLVTFAMIGLSLQALADTRQMLVTERDVGRQVFLPVDTVAVIELPANITTGHYWHLQSTKNKTWKHLGSEHIYPDTELKGAQGIQRIYLVGERAGLSDIELLYKRNRQVQALHRLSYQIMSAGAFTGRFQVPRALAPAPLKYVPSKQFPSYYNFCEEYGCTPIKDQGNCGSCWAFGTVGPLEQLILKEGTEVALSEQYLVSCNKDFWSCLFGGQFAHAYHKDKMVDSQTEAGAVLEEIYPYDPWFNPCGDENYPKAYQIEDWDYVSGQGMPEVDEIKEKMLAHGPIGVCICSNSGLSNYEDGVFEGPGCSGTNHIVTLTGWDDERGEHGAWHMRNSWGSNWGLDGYCWIAYGVSDVGEGATYVVYGSTEPRITVSGLQNFLAISDEGNPEAQQVTVTNATGEVLDWTATSDQAWLTINPANGVTPADVTVSADISGLAAGIHTATLTFTAVGAVNSPHPVTVDVEVVSIPALQIPYSDSTPAQDGNIMEGEYGAAATLDMDPGNPGSSMAYLQHDGQYIYIAMDAAADLDDDDFDTLAIYFDLNDDGLWPNAAADEGRFFVMGDGELQFHPVYNSGGGFETGATESSPAGLSAGYASGGDHRVVEVRLDMTASKLSLEPGDAFGLHMIYYDHIADDNYDVAGQWPAVMPTMEDCRCFGDASVGWLTPPEDLEVTPAALNFSGLLGGGLTAATDLNIGASEGGALAFTLAASEDWIKLSAPQGTTPGVIQVQADPSGLAVGTLNGEITVSAPDSGNQSVTVPVTFEVAEVLEDLVVDPTTLSFQAEEGAASTAAQTLNLSASAGGSLDFTAEASDAWIVLSATSGTTPGTVDVSANPAGLPAGTVNGTVTLTSTQAGNGPLTVAVSFEVSEQGTGPDEKEKSGCGCGTQVPVGPGALLLLALAGLIRRRRT